MHRTGDSFTELKIPTVRLKTAEDTFKVIANNGVTDEITLLKAR